MNSFWLPIGSFLMALAVIIGAFGSHALKNRLSDYSLEIYHTAHFYHVIHAVAILVVGLLAVARPNWNLSPWIGFLFLLGMLFFCGSLYTLALSGMKWLGAVTPIGGILFILAWLWLALQTWRAIGKS